MREREPMTQTEKASQARQEFSQLLNKGFRREAWVIVEKSRIPVAAIVSAEDLAVVCRFRLGAGDAVADASVLSSAGQVRRSVMPRLPTPLSRLLLPIPQTTGSRVRSHSP
jgi:prevent-host-death family protein